MKKIVIVVILMAFAVLPSLANLHKFYVSITEINVNQETQKLEISSKLFFDDLNNGMLVETGKGIDDPIENYATEIDAFFQHHFKLEANEKALPIKFIGVETEADAVWVHYESDILPQETERLTVTNTIFVNLFRTQANIINFYPKKGKAKNVKGLFLNSRKQSGTLKIK